MPTIEEAGGRVLVSARVKGIDIVNGRATGVTVTSVDKSGQSKTDAVSITAKYVRERSEHISLTSSTCIHSRLVPLPSTFARHISLTSSTYTHSRLVPLPPTFARPSFTHTHARFARRYGVISGAGAQVTHNLTPEKYRDALGYGRMLENVKASISHAYAFIGMKGTTEELGLRAANLWVLPVDDEYNYEGKEGASSEQSAPFAHTRVLQARPSMPRTSRATAGRSGRARETATITRICSCS